MRVASNFPTAYVRVASQTYVLQHIFIFICHSKYVSIDHFNVYVYVYGEVL